MSIATETLSAVHWTDNVRNSFRDRPISTMTIALLGSYFIPRILDPSGSDIKRPLWKRFFIITLPDNLPMALLIMLKYIPDLGALSHPPTLLVSFFMLGGACQALEITRLLMAWPVDKIPHRQAKDLAEFLGPRDFYAVIR